MATLPNRTFDNRVMNARDLVPVSENCQRIVLLAKTESVPSQPTIFPPCVEWN